MKIQHINPDSVFSVPIYTQMVTVSDATILYLSGQVAWDENGELIGKDDLEAQAVQAFANIGKLLAAVEADFTHVLKLTTYIVNFQPEHRAIYRDVLGRFVTLGNNAPASTLLGVQALAAPDLLIEIEAIAAIKGDL